jgi:hypothetical protein
MALTSTAPTDEDVRGEVLTELKFDAEVGQREIEVRPPVGDERTDADIAVAAAQALVDNRIVVRH